MTDYPLALRFFLASSVILALAFNLPMAAWSARLYRYSFSQHRGSLKDWREFEAVGGVLVLSVFVILALDWVLRGRAPETSGSSIALVLVAGFVGVGSTSWVAYSQRLARWAFWLGREGEARSPRWLLFHRILYPLLGLLVLGLSFFVAIRALGVV